MILDFFPTGNHLVAYTEKALNLRLLPCSGAEGKRLKLQASSLGKRGKKHVFFPFPHRVNFEGRSLDFRLLPEGRKRHPLKGVNFLSLAPLVTGESKAALLLPPNLPSPVRDLKTISLKIATGRNWKGVIETMTRCEWCGRPLRTPESIARGAGPVCLKRNGEQLRFFDSEIEGG